MSITEKQISELEKFFKNAAIPSNVQLDAGTTIIDVNKFIEGHLKVLRVSGDKPVFEVFYQRLLQLKDLLK